MPAKEESHASLKRRARAFNKGSREQCAKNRIKLKTIQKEKAAEFREIQKQEKADFVRTQGNMKAMLQANCKFGMTINMKQNENGLRIDLAKIKK
jgi:hypothetical protein